MKITKKTILKSVLAVAILAVIVIGAAKVGKIALDKAMFAYNSVLGEVNNITNTMKQINNKIPTNNVEIKDSLSDKGIRIKINDEVISLDFKYDNTVHSLNTLVANSTATVELGEVDGIIVEIDGKAIPANGNLELEIGKLSKENKIKVTVKSKNNSDYRNYFIQTLPNDFPTYSLIGKSQYEGDYLFNTGIYAGPFYLVQMDNNGDIVYYKNGVKNSFWFFKQHNINGKIRYSYFQADPTDTAVVNGYHKGEVVILDENHKEIDRVRLQPYGDLVNGYKPEGHGFYMIDDGHYILSAYVNKLADNIPADIPSLGGSTKVLASVLQEVKDGEVVWHWDSTDHPEFYELSLENNNFTDINTWHDYAHLNSMEIDPKDGNIIVSLRNLDSLVKIDRKTGETIWVLGGKGDEFGITKEQQFSRQHHATLLEDGRITLFDNGTESTQTSRVLEFTIDEENKKIVKCDEFRVGDRFGMYMGSAQKLDDENDVFLIGWGSADTDTAIFTEYDFKNNKIISELHLLDDSLNAYRVTKTK